LVTASRNAARTKMTRVTEPKQQIQITIFKTRQIKPTSLKQKMFLFQIKFFCALLVLVAVQINPRVCSLSYNPFEKFNKK
jgi:hypothetical protein